MNRKDITYETFGYINNFQQFETIRSFAKNIFNHIITLKGADENQSNLLDDIVEFKKNTKPKDFEKKKP